MRSSQTHRRRRARDVTASDDCEALWHVMGHRSGEIYLVLTDRGGDLAESGHVGRTSGTGGRAQLSGGRDRERD